MQRDKILNYLIYVIAVVPLILALYLEIRYNLTLKTLNTTKAGAIVVLLISISVMYMFVRATYDAYKYRNKFLQ